MEKQTFTVEQVEAIVILVANRFGGSSLEDYVSEKEVKEWFRDTFLSKADKQEG